MGIPIVGVGLLLFSGDRILTVKELKSKPQYCKQAGMISFPLETFEERDRHTKGTIRRLLKEELGIHNGEAKIWGIAPITFKLIPNRDDVITFYGVGEFLGDPQRDFQPEDTDIEIAGWKTFEQLLGEKLIRIEVEPILSHYQTITRKDLS